MQSGDTARSETRIIYWVDPEGVSLPITNILAHMQTIQGAQEQIQGPTLFTRTFQVMNIRTKSSRTS